MKRPTLEVVVNGKPVVMEWKEEIADGFTVTVLRARKHLELDYTPEVHKRPSIRGMDELTDLTTGGVMKERVLWFRVLLGYPKEADCWKLALADRDFCAFLREWKNWKELSYTALQNQDPLTKLDCQARLQHVRRQLGSIEERSGQDKVERTQRRSRAREAIEKMRRILEQ